MKHIPELPPDLLARRDVLRKRIVADQLAKTIVSAAMRAQAPDISDEMKDTAARVEERTQETIDMVKKFVDDVIEWQHANGIRPSLPLLTHLRLRLRWIANNLKIWLKIAWVDVQIAFFSVLVLAEDQFLNALNRLAAWLENRASHENQE